MFKEAFLEAQKHHKQTSAAGLSVSQDLLPRPENRWGHLYSNENHPREGFPSRGIWSLGAMVSGPGQDQEFPCCRRCRCRCRRRPLPRKVVFRNGSKKHKSGKTRSWLNFHADRKIEIEIVHTNSSRRSYLEGSNPLRRRTFFWKIGFGTNVQNWVLKKVEKSWNCGQI